MILNLQQIQSITNGAEYVTREPEGLRFWRFTEEQYALYQARDSMGMYNTPAGVRLCLRTDSAELYLKVSFQEYYAQRAFFSFDIRVDGEDIGHLDCYDREQVIGIHEKRFSLPDGVKTVDIYLPFTGLMFLQELGLSEGAYWEPVRRKKKLLALGDSITQGFDAQRPANTYVTRLADALGAECMNKAIGGDRTFPALAASEEPFRPDLITVAYGTNDLGHDTEPQFTAVYSRFLEELTRHYPGVPVFAISPIWRTNIHDKWPIGTFDDMDRVIRELCALYEDVVYVPGLAMVPHSPDWFQDRWVHPSDAGFAHYADNLLKAIAESGKML